jgi:hypothetical protein
MRKFVTKGRSIALLVGLAVFGVLGSVSPAFADCTATPTAELCASEVTTGLKSQFMTIVSANALLLLPLIAMAIALPFVFKAARSIVRKINI